MGVNCTLLSLSLAHTLSLCLYLCSLPLSLSLTSHSHMTARNIPSFAGARFQHPTPSDKHAQAYTHEDKDCIHTCGEHACTQAPDQWLPPSLVCQMTASVHMLIHGERHAEDCNHPGETCLPVVSASDCPQKQTNYIIKFTTVTS